MLLRSRLMMAPNADACFARSKKSFLMMVPAT
jgi:hypothetical protein